MTVPAPSAPAAPAGGFLNRPEVAARVARRKRGDRVLLIACALAAALGLFFLFWILGTLALRGLGALDYRIFTEITPPPGEEGGGLANAIAGSLLLVAIAMLVATPIGILTGTYLAEYGKYHRMAAVIRFVNDILLSSPSILIGLFVYVLLVAPLRGYMGVAGSVALGLIAIPVIVRTTEDMLRLVPQNLREAASAVGAPRNLVIWAVCWRAAKAGIATGVLLALARIFGETAPLLFTALNSQFWSFDLLGPMANLPVTIYAMAVSPYDRWRELGWAGAFLITTIILVLSLIVRLSLRGAQDQR